MTLAISCSGNEAEGYKRLYIARVTCARAVSLLTLPVTVTLNIKMSCLILLAGIAAVAHARPGLLFADPLQPIGVQYAQPSHVVHPHPAVELNAASEALLPRELLKSRDFYDHPSIADGLAKESWFTKKEMQVVEREAEKIPRDKIYQIVKNAGFLDNH